MAQGLEGNRSGTVDELRAETGNEHPYYRRHVSGGYALKRAT